MILQCFDLPHTLVTYHNRVTDRYEEGIVSGIYRRVNIFPIEDLLLLCDRFKRLIRVWSSWVSSRHQPLNPSLLRQDPDSPAILQLTTGYESWSVDSCFCPDNFSFLANLPLQRGVHRILSLVI